MTPHDPPSPHAAEPEHRYAVATIDATSSPAFEEAGVRAEASRVLLAAAARVRDGLGWESFALVDSKGQEVGRFMLCGHLPTAPGPVPGGDGWISVQVDLAHEAFRPGKEDLLLTYLLGDAALQLAASGDGDGFLLSAPGGQLVGGVVLSALPLAELDVGLAPPSGVDGPPQDEPGL